MLDAIFRPRSIAVIGASRRSRTIGREVLRNLVDFEFNGPVYPVNPTADVVHSMKAYKRLEDISDPVAVNLIRLRPPKTPQEAELRKPPEPPPPTTGR